jgi:hypothetical protein
MGPSDDLMSSGQQQSFRGFVGRYSEGARTTESGDGTGRSGGELRAPCLPRRRHEIRGRGSRGRGSGRATDLAPAGVDLALQLVTQPPHLVEDLPERGWVQGTDCPSRCVELCEQIAA